MRLHWGLEQPQEKYGENQAVREGKFLVSSNRECIFRSLKKPTGPCDSIGESHDSVHYPCTGYGHGDTIAKGDRWPSMICGRCLDDPWWVVGGSYLNHMVRGEWYHQNRGPNIYFSWEGIVTLCESRWPGTVPMHRSVGRQDLKYTVRVIPWCLPYRCLITHYSCEGVTTLCEFRRPGTVPMHINVLCEGCIISYCPWQE